MANKQLKKQIVTVISLIALCSVLAVPVMLNYPSESTDTTNPTPQDTQQPPELTPQTSQFASQNTPTATQKTSKPTQQPSSQTTPQTIALSSNRTLSEAIGNATNYLQNINEPYAFLWLNVAYRRFNITLFADSLQRYDQAMAQISQENLPSMRVFRRIADHNNTLQSGDLQAITGETDKLTAPALYCNRYGLSSNYKVTLAQAASSQGYTVTHALLASIWINENGFGLSMPAVFYNSLYRANAALINNDAVVTDVELEAATFLYFSGQNSMIASGFIPSVVAAQNSDGGWTVSNASTDSSNWHSSVLALLLLFHQQYPAASYPPMLATA